MNDLQQKYKLVREELAITQKQLYMLQAKHNQSADSFNNGSQNSPLKDQLSLK